MKATVADIIQVMERVAPVQLAEDWDNVGLQVGEKSWPVKKIWIALDPTPEVVTAACKNKVDLLITHHPLIFSALTNVDFSTYPGSIIRLAGNHKLAIFSAHTNLDNTRTGLNDILAKKIGLKNIKVLKQSKTEGIYKLVVFIPAAFEKRILDALIEMNSVTAGHYNQCSFRHYEQAPFTQRKEATSLKESTSEKESGRIESADEIRVEATVNKENLSKVIDTIKTLHPYDVMPYDIYPLFTQETGNGTGRIGELIISARLSCFADNIRKKFGIKFIKIVGNPDMHIDRAAVCSGSGSSLMNEFISSGAQVFVSGDLRYHDARLAEQADLAIIDIGHFVSEFIIVDELEKRLRKIFDEKQIEVSVEACSIETDPFWTLHD
ncbi:MAG: Nif3-like dinuclear metal center hexameric protein [Deltaproteobacteria bacterium]|nr:Nif3-like dinuclear metal center hexameric protein [Deltaproteobacteria bacterium]MBW1846671.1 Nif3-like dinuclear metal center hexameric protein [Deltaproteobacteria bacterium]